MNIDMKDEKITALAQSIVKENLTSEEMDQVFRSLRKQVIESALEAELDAHLGYAKYASAGRNSGNSRNGKSSKTLKEEKGELTIAVPRDRQGSFEPQLVKRGQTRSGVIDEQIIALYAKGMTTREIAEMIKQLYDVDVSPTLISHVTDRVMDEVVEWQARPLDALYPIVYMDCLVLKIRDGKQVKNKSVFLALGINVDGQKELLGLWLAENEGAKFWLSVLTELQSRGLKDILIACVDGLKGFPDAIEAVYPQTKVQLCIVHMVRHSLRFVSWKDYRAVTADLKRIYQAPTEDMALLALDEFKTLWPGYSQIAKSWESNWANLRTLFDYPDEIRRAIYTTNAIESLNSVIRKATKRHKMFPSDEAALKVVYLAITEASKKWTMPIRNWRQALNRFSIEFGERVTDHL